jgi:hypothetical protein
MVGVESGKLMTSLKKTTSVWEMEPSLGDLLTVRVPLDTLVTLSRAAKQRQGRSVGLQAAKALILVSAQLVPPMPLRTKIPCANPRPWRVGVPALSKTTPMRAVLQALVWHAQRPQVGPPQMAGVPQRARPLPLAQPENAPKTLLPPSKLTVTKPTLMTRSPVVLLRRVRSAVKVSSPRVCALQAGRTWQQ